MSWGSDDGWGWDDGGEWDDGGWDWDWDGGWGKENTDPAAQDNPTVDA
jgi:hypothetical protein